MKSTSGVRALAAALTISAAMALTGNQAHPAEAAPAAGDEATAPLPTVTVRQLYDEFHRDFAAAQQKYQGKTLRVTGKIRSINPTIAGEPGFLNLTATGYDTFVECAISEADKPRLLPLNRGQKLSAIGQEPTVTVVGTVSRIFGGSLTGYVLLQPVTLPATSVTPGPDTSTKTNAAPKNPPLGEYAVYQSVGAAGFGYQYRFTLVSGTRYRVYDNEWGDYVYNPQTKVLRFRTGSLKGFVGLYYTHGRNNEKGEPVICLNPQTAVPDLAGATNGAYQYAYFRPDGVK